MKRLILLAAMAAGSAPALSAEIKPIVDLRLRYEGVEQAGLPRDADAVTLRGRVGAEIKADDFSFLAEGEATGALGRRYNDGLGGRAAFPIVADPETAELNRLQVQYRGLPKTVVTLGRQRINLDDQRFVGGVAWRQNEQTFDALRFEWAGVPRLRADISYVWSVRTIWGDDGTPARPTAISGNNVFAELSWETPIGTATGFAILVDQDEAALSGFRLSSQTYGARLRGSRKIGTGAKLVYAAAYARQSDWHRNPNDYSADYWLLDAGLELGGFRLGAGYEVLGADRGGALTSVQTPLATLHKFQGFADKFLVTPPNGIRDRYASAGYGRGRFNAQAVWHRFDSDRLDQRYGDEIDLVASARFERFAVLAKYADYDARGFATDTRKFWLQLEWAY